MDMRDYIRSLEGLNEELKREGNPARNPRQRASQDNGTRQRYATGGDVRQKEKIKELAAKGRYGDTEIAEIGSHTARFLDDLIHGGRKEINPRTGLREYPPKKKAKKFVAGWKAKEEAEAPKPTALAAGAPEVPVAPAPKSKADKALEATLAPQPPKKKGKEEIKAAPPSPPPAGGADSDTDADFFQGVKPNFAAHHLMHVPRSRAQDEEYILDKARAMTRKRTGAYKNAVIGLSNEGARDWRQSLATAQVQKNLRRTGMPAEVPLPRGRVVEIAGPDGRRTAAGDAYEDLLYPRGGSDVNISGNPQQNPMVEPYHLDSLAARVFPKQIPRKGKL